MRHLNTPVQVWQGQRVWLVGASSGIGAARASAALDAGAKVILSARNSAPLEALAAQHINALAVPFDVQDNDAWAHQYGKICRHWGGVDLIVFCAADYCPQRSWEVTAAAARTLAVNLTSVYSGIAAVLPDTLARGSGGVAIIASMAGYVGLPNATVYGPSKAALINLAELLHCDLHPLGLSVYLINPGFVQKPLTAKNDFHMPALLTPQQAAQAIVRGMGTGRFQIHFPRRFTCAPKLARWLPYRLQFALLARLVPQQ